MDHARAGLLHGLAEIDHKKRFKVYIPHTGETPIYVHAKLTIFDDRILRIGSANFNNRSMGLDSECDVFIDCDRPGNGHACDGIAALRHSLLAEHCGLEEDDVARLLETDGSMHHLIAEHGQGDGRSLKPYEVPELNGVEETLADSGLLDPERPDDMFEPFAKGGLFRKGSMLGRAYGRAKKRIGR